MSVLNLENQATIAAQIQTRILTLRDRLAERLPIWRKLPLEKKKAWVKSGKDPIMTITWQIYKYLRDNFFEVDEDYNG